MYKEFDMRGVGVKSKLSKTGFGATTEKYVCGVFLVFL